MNIQPITRNGAAVLIAVLAALTLVSAPVAAMFAIWNNEIRWLYTAGALLVLALALYGIATQVYDRTPIEVPEVSE